MKNAERIALSLIVLVVLSASAASAQRTRDTRESWLAHLVTTVRTLPHTEADAARMCEGLQPSGVTCTVLPAGSYPCEQNGQRAMCRAYSFSFEFTTPMRAQSVANAFGWREVRIVSGDVHMSQWQLEPRDEAARIVGNWDVRASVDRPTTGRTNERVGPNPVYAVDARTPVLRLSFSLDLSQPHAGVPSRLTR